MDMDSTKRGPRYHLQVIRVDAPAHAAQVVGLMSANDTTTTTARRVLPMPRYAPGDGEMVRSESGEFVRLDDVRLLLAWLRGNMAEAVGRVL